jgi:DNA-binding SARP family transcriptional activator
MIQITLFGPFEVRCEDNPVRGLEARKAQELLAYLLIQRGRAWSREFLAELLWGQRIPAQSKKYLRQTLWQVQSALAAQTSEPAVADLLALDGEWIRYNEQCAVQLDVAAFEQAHNRAEGVPGSELDGQEAVALRQAVQLYRGDLMPGCYEDWCLFERERLQTIYLAMLDKLIDCCQRHRQFEQGLAYGETILRYDRARECTHRRMMALYYLAGDRTSALRQYEQLARALREELDVQPSRRSAALRDQIRADSFDDSPLPLGNPLPTHRFQPSDAAADSRQHLRRLHSSLLQMQRQIGQEIAAIELALADS